MTESHLTRIVSNAPDIIGELDPRGIITYVNRAPPGYTVSEMEGTPLERWLVDEGQAAFRSALARVLEHRETTSFETVGVVTGIQWVIRLGPVLTEGRVSSVVMVGHDVAAQKASETQLRESEHWLRSLVDAAFEGLLVSVDGIIIDANDAAAKLFGYTREELIGMSASELTTPESAARIFTNIRARMEIPYEVEAVTKDGRTVPCELRGRNVMHHGRPARLTGLRDLTEKRRLEHEQEQLEQQMGQAQKLESLGVLAGGIAHDFNNLLQIVVGNIDLALLALPGGGLATEPRAHLEQAREVVQRASELTRQMLVYAGKGSISVGPVDLGEVVREMAELLAVSVPKNAELVLRVLDEVPTVHGDASQLRQVVLNLVTNAAEAIGERPGRIELSTREARLDDFSGLLVNDAPSPGEFVLLEVADDGCGIPPEIVAKLFDPFFTTKFTGRGLGLTSVRGIVRAHRGAIAVRTASGQGTRFCVYLPVHGGPGSSRDVRTAPEPPERLAGRVLVAEDEPELRALLLRTLESAGLTVELASNGRAAVDAFALRPDHFDAVILDLTMPVLGGREALRELRALRPDLPALLLSGYSLDDTDVTSQRRTAFLAKPFKLEELVAAVGDLLASSRRDA